ncbi:hypothetical protein HDU97_003942 [Phlyctochytrium planicorne]|nr:hypothetical protein HDU97_003942 [Phlyctochytrium planicorne]
MGDRHRWRRAVASAAVTACALSYYIRPCFASIEDAASKLPSELLDAIMNIDHVPHRKPAFVSIPEQARNEAEESLPRVTFHQHTRNARRNRRIIPGTYIVELEPDVENARDHILEHLARSGGLEKDHVNFRTELVQRIKRMHPFKTEGPIVSNSLWSSEGNQTSPTDIANLHLMTGVQRARDELGLTGKGVKVAIIDSGVYHEHPALGGGFGPGHKIAFGYDLVGDKYVDETSHPEPDSDPLDNCSTESHGTHVADRVFGCGAESTSTDILMKALYMAHLDGADIINLSLGGGPSFGLDADAVAAARVANRGALIVGAAGNDGHHGLLTSGGTGSHDDLVSVASFDSVATSSFSLIGGEDEFPYTPSDSATSLIDADKTIPFSFNNPEALRNPSIIDDGCSGPTYNVSGKIVVYAMQPGKGCTSYVRFRKAHDAGAAGCLLYDNSQDRHGRNNVMGYNKLPGGGVTKDVAESLWSLKSKSPNAGLRMTWMPYNAERLFYQATKSLATKLVPIGKVSSFSSPGLRGDLALKPDLGAPGANIFSTVSPKAASHAGMPWAYNLMSGTSMASPYFAGALALYLEAKGKYRNEHADGETLRNERSNVLRAFSNTARPARISPESNLYHSVAFQGAGLIDVYSAITTLTDVSPRSFALNDTKHSSVVYNMTITNRHTRPVTYTIDNEGSATVFPFSENGSKVSEQLEHSSHTPDVKFSKGLSERSFTLKAGESRGIKLAIIPPMNMPQDRFPIYSGYIRITSDAVDAPITVPYAGMIGSWSKANLWVQPQPYTDFVEKLDPQVSGVFDWIEEGKKGHLGLIQPLASLNASDGVLVKTVLASPSRLMRIEVVTPAEEKTIKGKMVETKVEEVKGLIVLDKKDASAMGEFHYVPRNSKTDGESVFTENAYLFHGEVTKDGKEAFKLPQGKYAIKFSALKHFSPSENDENNFETFYSPPFTLTY